MNSFLEPCGKNSGVAVTPWRCEVDSRVSVFAVSPKRLLHSKKVYSWSLVKILVSTENRKIELRYVETPEKEL
jgi:hypothetical protein